MKTIHTDIFGLLPWTYLLLSAGAFGSACDMMVRGGRGPFGIGGNAGLAVFALAGLAWLVLAISRFRQVRQAKREGRDPAIVRVETGR
jgi:hypothetical protein